MRARGLEREKGLRSTEFKAGSVKLCSWGVQLFAFTGHFARLAVDWENEDDNYARRMECSMRCEILRKLGQRRQWWSCKQSRVARERLTRVVTHRKIFHLSRTVSVSPAQPRLHSCEVRRFMPRPVKTSALSLYDADDRIARSVVIQAYRRKRGGYLQCTQHWWPPAHKRAQPSPAMLT